MTDEQLCIERTSYESALPDTKPQLKMCVNGYPGVDKNYNLKSGGDFQRLELDESEHTELNVDSNATDNGIGEVRHPSIDNELLTSQSSMQKQCEPTRPSPPITGNISSLQSKYRQALEEFKVLRSNLSENMERNLNRTNNALLRHQSATLQHTRPEHSLSQENLVRGISEPTPRSRIYTDSHDPRSRVVNQTRARHRYSDATLEERVPDDYLRSSPKTVQRLLANNNLEFSGYLAGDETRSHPHDLVRKQSDTRSLGETDRGKVLLRDQPPRDSPQRSSFEKYLRGSVTDMSEELNGATDTGYGGSGNTSPRGDIESQVIPAGDHLSSRSDSMNSRSSSAMASVDSGVRMSFLGNQATLVVVAIDFGTTFSGYAFSFTRDASSIHMMRKWEGGDPGVTNQKTPTTLLLKPDGSFHSFGFGARDFYHDLDASEAKKWLYFEKFKMKLHSSSDLHAGIEIRAANGKPYPALKIFSHSLRFFKDHVLAELSDQSTAKLTEEDITWVITVPAIWRQPAKQFMRTAAYEAGIASLDTPDRLLIALEPEAASIFCRKLRMRDCVIEDDIKAKAGDDSLISEDFAGVTQYLVVDCGGGTVDLTVHELDVSHGTLKELHKGTGGPCGATGIDREFEKLLKKVFDAEFIERFKLKRPASWVDLMISFEAKKRTARPDNQNPLNISLPFSFIEYHKKHRKQSVENAVKKFKNPDIKWSSQGMLRLSPNIMQQMFDPVLLDIIGHIQNLLTKPSLKHVEYMFLVGGFAESPLLQHAVREALEGRVHVIIPNDVGLAILKGAVLFGLDPTVVRVRRSAFTYGVGVLNKFDSEKHDQTKRVVKDGIVWCKDIFDRFVRVDESVGIGDRVTRSYAPARSNQKSTVINIYCTEKLDVTYTTEKDVQKCGKLRIEMPDIEIADIPVEKRGKPRELQATMTFGDTEIKVSAVDVLSGRAARAIIDFLNY